MQQPNNSPNIQSRAIIIDDAHLPDKPTEILPRINSNTRLRQMNQKLDNIRYVNNFDILDESATDQEQL